MGTNSGESWVLAGATTPYGSNSTPAVASSLLCGSAGDWHPSQLTALRHRYPSTLTVRHMTREARPGALEDFHGQVLARLGVDRTAQYLIRPDGHIGYRCGGDDLAGLQRYLARWLPNTASRPA